MSTSEGFQTMIKSLLTEPDKRPSFSQLKEYSFFSAVDWEHLLAGEKYGPGALLFVE